MSGEKRKYPRIKDANISLKVKSGDIDIITKSLDISASGIYCKVQKEIPVMSRIKSRLILPGGVTVETDGVVVREHPVIEDGRITHYDVAIFFDNVSAKDREAILAYIKKKS